MNKIMESQNLKTEIKAGEGEYLNKNCWLARSLGHSPSSRCMYCELKFRNCLFEQYLVISLVLVVALAAISYILDGSISKSLVVSVFILVVVYGYFFSKSTEKIIISNFEEKKVKNAFKDLSDNLQKKVDEQTRELRKAYEIEKLAKEQLEELDNIKDQFLITIQHHLRTPLTSMMGYTDLLLGGNFGMLPKKSKDVVKRLGASTSDLIKMVNDFLNVTQFQLGKQVIVLKDKTNIYFLLKSILKDFELQAKERGISLKFKCPEKACLAESDELKLKAALTNIIDNAIKYTKKGSVYINVQVNGSQIKIEIKDTGIGISKERLSKIFDITFERTKESQKNFATGRGIGLFLSSQIIKAHNGKVWAESEGRGKGSTFYVVLPAAENL